MAYKVTISGGIVLEQCIKAVSFQVDTHNEYSDMWSTTRNSMIIKGRIDTDESTSILYKWALFPGTNPDCYKEITVEQYNSNELVRKVCFSKAFVVDYSESYSNYEGTGTFTLYLRQLFGKEIECIGQVHKQPIEVAEHIDTIEERVESSEKEIVNDKIKSVSSNGKSHMSITERIAKQKEIQDNSNIAEENKTEVSVTEKEKSNKSLYSRSGFRKSARQSAVDDAPKNISGEMICPTCGKVIPEAIIQDTVNGPRKRVGYDLDHYPDTWAERVGQLKQRDPPPTRKEVLEEYNKDLRVQCPKCNQGHEFEGVEGIYKGEK